LDGIKVAKIQPAANAWMAAVTSVPKAGHQCGQFEKGRESW